MSPAPGAPRLYDAQGASVYVNGVKSPRWFKDQMRAGAIDAYRIGQTWCVAETELDRLIAESFRPAGNYGRPAAQATARSKRKLRAI